MTKDTTRRVFSGDSEMARVMRAYKWSDSALGPTSKWPIALHAAVEILLASNLASFVVWGSQQTVLYNDTGLKLLGPEHSPSAFARSGQHVWGATWAPLVATCERMLRDHKPCLVEVGDALVFSCAPIVGDSGDIEGVFCTCPRPVPAVVPGPEPADTLETAADVVGGPRKPRVLLIDRDHETKTELRELLRADYVVEAVDDGDRAIESARRDPPVAIVMDLSEPGIAGVELLRALRTEPLTSHVPLMIISARAAEDTRIEALCAGADDYVSKPFSAREVVVRLRTQIQLSKMRMEIGAVRAAARAKDDFLSLLGHELRNPLAALSTTIQGLLMRGSSPEIELMERAARQLTHLVDDLLDISRLSRGSIRLDAVPVEIAHVVDDAIERIQPLLTERKTQVFVRIPRSGMTIVCDRQRMAQALAHVLSNACKFSAPGSSVSVQALRVEERVQIRIKDSGCGIEPSRLATVFDAFDHGTDAPGLGIGLAIARGLTELHDGSISVSSVGLGHGTECVLELPSGADVIGKPAQVPSRSRKRVLLVEDNHDTALALKRGLEQLGYQVALAHNGPVALTVARSFQPDVALLDIGLPVMDGWELARRLRELRVPSKELHFVAVTARDQDEDKQRSHDAGFADHLVKPIDLVKLERVVEGLPSPG